MYAERGVEEEAKLRRGDESGRLGSFRASRKRRGVHDAHQQPQRSLATESYSHRGWGDRDVGTMSGRTAAEPAFAIVPRGGYRAADAGCTSTPGWLAAPSPSSRARRESGVQFGDCVDRRADGLVPRLRRGAHTPCGSRELESVCAPGGVLRRPSITNRPRQLGRRRS